MYNATLESNKDKQTCKATGCRAFSGEVELPLSGGNQDVEREEGPTW